jgi:hypothetical protein
MDKTTHRFLNHLPPGAQSLVLDIRQDPQLEHLRQMVLNRRDSAILACMLEIAVSVASLALYDLRRSMLIPILNTTLTVLSGIGLSGAMTLSLKRIQIHGIVTTGLIIACILNFVAEALLTSTGIGSDTLPGWAVLIAILVPYSVNLGCSSLSLMLGSVLSDFLQKEEEATGLSDERIEQNAQDIQVRGEDSCCVCMDKRKDAALVPCGHKVMCLACAQLLQARERKCPVCRRSIDNVVRVFD